MALPLVTIFIDILYFIRSALYYTYYLYCTLVPEFCLLLRTFGEGKYVVLHWYIIYELQTQTRQVAYRRR